MGDRSRVTGIGEQPRRGVDQTQALVSGVQKEHTEFERTCPPSKAAVTFYLQRFSSGNGSSVSSPVAGTAYSIRGLSVASVANI